MEHSKLVQHLTAVKNILTPETWQKGSYFKIRNNTLCMCAHGALQAQVNPEVKRILNNHFDLSEASAAAAVAAAVAASAAAVAAARVAGRRRWRWRWRWRRWRMQG